MLKLPDKKYLKEVSLDTKLTYKEDTEEVTFQVTGLLYKNDLDTSVRYLFSDIGYRETYFDDTGSCYATHLMEYISVEDKQYTEKELQLLAQDIANILRKESI